MMYYFCRNTAWGSDEGSRTGSVLGSVNVKPDKSLRTTRELRRTSVEQIYFSVGQELWSTQLELFDLTFHLRAREPETAM